MRLRLMRVSEQGPDLDMGISHSDCIHILQMELLTCADGVQEWVRRMLRQDCDYYTLTDKTYISWENN